MENALFSFDGLNFCGVLKKQMSTTDTSSVISGGGGCTGTQCNFDGSFRPNGTAEPAHSFHSDGGGYAGKECNFDGLVRWDGIAESGVVHSFHSGGAGLLQDNLHLQELVSWNYDQQQQQLFAGYGAFNDLQSDYIFSSILTHEEEEISNFGEFQFGIQENEPKKEKIRNPATSLELIKDFGSRVKRFKSERVIEPTSVEVPIMDSVDDELSTVEILQIAAAKFVQSCSAGKLLDTPYSMVDLSLGGVPDEYAKKVELAETLMAVAEKVGNEQFESANRLLTHCQELSSSTGNPVERVGYYFSAALQDRIDAKKEKVEPDGLQKKKKKQSFDLDNARVTEGTKMLLDCREALPFCQVSHFAGIQAIVENVKEAKRIHIIDLVIMNGVQWTILMQSLAARSENHFEHLKITALGTASKNSIEDTGKRLTCFAESLKLPFSFKMVMESELVDLKHELLELDGEETVAIYSAFLPRFMIAMPDRLDSIMKAFSDICPCIMVVAEVESDQNSSSFVHRFVETLFFYGAYFDCLNTCMEKDNHTRRITESAYFAQGIKNVLAAEGEERMIRNVNLDAWRKFFARFAMEETELSSSCLCAAKLTLQRSPNWSFCNLDSDGKSLVLGWKGTPLHSLSAWKFLPGPGKKSTRGHLISKKKT